MENLVSVTDAAYLKLVSLTDIAHIKRVGTNVGGYRYRLEITYKGGANISLDENEEKRFWKAVSNKGVELYGSN